MPTRFPQIRHALALSLLLLSNSCKQKTTEPVTTNCAERFCVLFVGGSLEYWNDMPRMLEAISRNHPAGKVIIGESFLSDAHLGDHLTAGDAAEQIATNRWNVVSLGQGPSSRTDSRVLLRQWSAQFAQLIKPTGATPALFMAWPRVENFADFPGASTSYRLAAADIDATLFPVADAWLAAWARDPDIALYSDDGWHPSVEGSYLSALVIHASLYRTTTVGLPREFQMPLGSTVSIDPAVAAVLQAAADEAVFSIMPE